jgi:hypothetical protein
MTPWAMKARNWTRDQPAGKGPPTWPGFATRLAELVTESWDNVFRLCVFLLALALAGLAWWWLHALIW